ncbi:MAG: SBBP repeat-containing protein [Planctomycetes bacterium]|nr:SBBP repeat-containing protein [Planctomycetota bacterium]
MSGLISGGCPALGDRGPGPYCNDVGGSCCDEDSDCDDGLFCNGQAVCVVAFGYCIVEDVSCGAGERCDEEANACVPICHGDADCDDGAFCNGGEACTDGACVPGTAPCPDTPEGCKPCDETNDVCATPCDDDTDCSNGVFCDGQEVCDGCVCQSGIPPCPAGHTCDEAAGQCVADDGSTNHPPQVMDITVQGSADTPMTVTLTGSDANGDDLTFEVVVPPEHGTLSPLDNTASASATATYTPPPGFAGTVTFTFRAGDGWLVSTLATAFIKLDMNPPGPSVFSLGYSTYLGGSEEDTIRDIAADAQGNTYVVGGTASPDFPATAGAYDTALDASTTHVHDVFIAKFGADGQLIWATYLGGPNFDIPLAMELDAQGAVYVAGQAGPGFPTTAGIIQPTFGGDQNPDAFYGPQDGFVAKVSPDGSGLEWSTYFGQPDNTTIRDIDIDSDGNVYLAMPNVQVDCPHITAGAFETVRPGGGDGVVAKISADGTAVLWATYLGGTGRDLGTPSIRVSADGYVYVLGYTNSSDIPTTIGAYDRTYNGGGDLFLAKLTPDGSALAFATYLGGSGVEYSETHGLARDAARHRVFVAATTTSSDFPTTTGAWQRTYGGTGGSGRGANTNYPGDGFVAAFDSDTGALLAATYLGGADGEGIEGVGVDSAGKVYVSGATFSASFPVTGNALQPTIGGRGDFFAARLTPTLDALDFASFLGGGGDDFARTMDVAHGWRIAGHSKSDDWPLEAAWQMQRGGNWDGTFAVISETHPVPP